MAGKKRTRSEMDPLNRVFMRPRGDEASAPEDGRGQDTTGTPQNYPREFPDIPLPAFGSESDEAIAESLSIQENMQNDPVLQQALQTAAEVSVEHMRPPIHDVPVAWSNIEPDWMPPVNQHLTERPRPFHSFVRTFIVRVATHMNPKAPVEYLEMFRALYPSIAYLTKQLPRDEFEIDLRKTYQGRIDEWKKILDEEGKDSTNMPVLPEEWYNYVEDWDVAGRSDDVKDRMISNWDNPAREGWKQRMCPLVFHPDGCKNKKSQEALAWMRQNVGLARTVTLQWSEEQNTAVIKGLEL